MKKSEFWAEHVAAAKREELSLVKYAKRHDLSLPSLRYWRRKLKRAPEINAVAETNYSAAVHAGKFVALQIEGKPIGYPNDCALLLSGMTLTMPSLPAPEWLAALGQAMRGVR